MTLRETLWRSLVACLNSGMTREARRRRRGQRAWSVERLESRQLLATFSVGNSGVAATGVDYFAIEQNNALDYTEAQNNNQSGADDRVNAGFDDQGVSSTSVSGGKYNFTTSGGGLIYILHPGYFDGEAGAGAPRTAGVVPEEKSGESIPIDTSKYFVLNMMLTAPLTFPDPLVVGAGAVQGNIQWYDGRDVGSNTATRPFFVFPGTRIYSFNLSSISLVGAQASGPWTGKISGVRIYPSNNGSASNISIDWVTLTGVNQSSLPVTISGASGNVEVGLSLDGNPANLIKVMKPQGNSDNDFIFTLRNIVGPATQSSLTSVDTTFLGSGTYFLHALDASGNVLSGTTAQQITVNNIPRLTVLQPDNRGDESSDYATLFRNDSWDFLQTTDYSVPFNPPETASHYGVPTVVNNPTTSLAGQLAGDWMRYDNTTATGPVSGAKNDPHFLLTQNGSIDVSVYRNLTIRMLLDKPRDIPNGAIMRVMWSRNNPIVADADINQSDDIIIQQGVLELHLDMSSIKIEPNSTGQSPWTTGAVKYLRIDPHEFLSDTVAYFDQVLLTRNDRTSSGVFNITWSATDANAGQNITVSAIYLDTDKNPDNGKGTLLTTNETNDGSFTFNAASFPALAAGSYYVLMEFTDGLNNSYRYSTGKLDVDLTPAPNSAPILNSSGSPYLTAPAGTRLPTEMSNGILVTDLLARGAGGDPITDADAGALEGIAVTGISKIDGTFGTWEYTLVANPTASDWISMEAAGTPSNSNALLLPADSLARVRFVTTLTPRHNTTATDGTPRGPAQGFLPIETKLDTGLTFRAWDRTSGTSGGRANTSTNGGTTAFSVGTETVGTYFETRLFRSFNATAQLNTYTLEQEFSALTSLFGYQDRSDSNYSGFTVFLSQIPGVSMSSLYRLYYGIQFNAGGSQTDMGYRYLTIDVNEAQFLESLGPPEFRAQRDGCYFRELGVNSGTAILGYIYATQQPGTTAMSQIYRTDLFPKDTRTGPPGTPATGSVQQEQGDHVYTTKSAFEMTKPGTWRQESQRGFVRELSPNVGGSQQPARRESARAVSGAALVPDLWMAPRQGAAGSESLAGLLIPSERTNSSSNSPAVVLYVAGGPRPIDASGARRIDLRLIDDDGEVGSLVEATWSSIGLEFADFFAAYS